MVTPTGFQAKEKPLQVQVTELGQLKPGEKVDQVKRAFSKSLETRYGEFIKMSELKDVINEVCFPLLEAMRVREEESIRANNCINQIFKDIKEMQSTTRSAVAFKNQLNKVNRHVEKIDQENKLFKEQFRMVGAQVEARCYKLEMQIEAQQAEMQEFIDVSHKRNQAYNHLNENFENFIKDMVD